MKLWMLRHAAVSLPAGLCYGATDVPADAELTRQAAQTAAAQLPLNLTVWTSRLQRTQQLGRQLHLLRGDLPPTRADNRLDEMNFGRWEMQPWDAVPTRAYDDWTADFADHRFGGVESTQMVIHRVASALADTVAAHGLAGQALWITHAGVIKAVHYLLEHGGRRIGQASEWPKVSTPPGALLNVDVNATLRG